MPWEELAPLLKDVSAHPHQPYNFLRDLEPEALKRLDAVLERHLKVDENKATSKWAINGHVSVPSGSVTCRYECGGKFKNSWVRGQHERNVHGGAWPNGM